MMGVVIRSCCMRTTLREFVSALERAGELKRITERVSPVLEIAALADIVSKSRAPHEGSSGTRRTDPRFFDRGGPALLFENVEGSATPVLINALGSYRRVEMALGCERDGLEGLATRIGDLVKPEPPRSLGEALAKARQFAPLMRIGPKRRGRGVCQEVVLRGEQIDLMKLPLIRCWPLDGDFEAVGYPAGVNDGVAGLGRGAEWDEKWRGRYITLGGIHTIHADDVDEAKPKSHNIGMYRVQLLGRDRMAMHWHMHHDGANHWRSWKKLGKRMPVAIALGGEPVLPYAATAPLPPGISELLLAGFLNGGGIEMVRGKTVPLWVPANAEIVIEGYVSDEAGLIGYDPRTDGPIGPGAVFEGPFGDHTGFYSMPDRYPVLEVTAITHREEPIYPTTVVGLPIQEDYFLGKATERIFLPLLKTLIPDIVDYDLPLFGAFHNCAVIQIKKHYPLHARRVMHAVWGAGQMSWTKAIVVVDEGVDPHDTMAVLRACAAHCRPDRDVEIVNGPLDILDHAAPRLGAGTKIGFDCTKKVAGEEVGGIGVDGRMWDAPDAGGRAEFVERVRRIAGVMDAAWPEVCGGWAFVRADKRLGERGKEGLGRRIASEVSGIDGRGPRFVVVVGADVDLHDPDRVLFHWVANSDAGRDMVRVKSEDGGRIVFDAAPKGQGDGANGEAVRAWPPVLEMDGRASARAREIAGRIGMDVG